jgi:hypothetical protein
MIEQAITVNKDQIEILAQYFIHKDYSVLNKDLLVDVLGKYYVDQEIVIKLMDGENMQFSGFDHLIKYICDNLHIPYTKILIHTHDPDSHDLFNIEHLELGIFVSVNQYLPKDFDRDLTNAKFVGSLLGRYNLSRLRLAYELDQAFATDTFVTFQPKLNFIQNKLQNFNSLYEQELSWLETKTFDKDLVSGHYMGMIDWYDACRNYGQVWNRYLIEVVSETDAMDNFWFTEKTANCLATGKPFVLVSGTGSLKRLQDMGFQTFGEVIDETYDCATHPYNRVQQIVKSLQALYTSADKNQLVDSLYKLAQRNIELYNNYIKKLTY